MGKTGNQILEQIKLELEQLKAKTVELEQRITELSASEKEEQEDKPFDILLEDEISFVIPKRREELGVVTPDPEPLAEPEIEPVAEVEPVVEIEPTVEVAVEVEPVVEADPEVKVAADVEPVVEAEPEVEVAADVEPVVEADPEVEVAAEVEPVAEAEPEVEVAIEVEPVVEADPEVKVAAEIETNAGEVVFEPEPIEVLKESEPVAPEPKPAPEKAAPKPEVKRRWQLDTPASELSNILSAIALKERGVFINALFKEDAQLFIDTIAAMNAMTSLSQAEEYVKEHFSYWKLDSDVVYRFMMAVRRKLR